VSCVRVGSELLELARSAGARTIHVVGIGRDVGKTTALEAIYAAAVRAGLRVGLAAMHTKHRLWLHRETIFVTARGALPRSPGVEILRTSRLSSPAGTLLYARAASSAFYDLVGPSTAAGVREIVDDLEAGSEFVAIDGAVDRIASLAGTDGAIVVSSGAAAATTMREAVDEIAALVERLRVPLYDAREPAIEVDGALTAAGAAAFIAARETRQIVVRDPTQIALSGKAAVGALARLNVRCKRPLRVIAATIASIGLERTFEPRAFASAVAAATALPTFDVYAGSRAA